MSFDAVFERMATDLDISKGKREDALSWRCRIAYSVAAKRGLDSLWEKEEGGEQGTVSLIHITRTIGQVFRAFHMLCPDIEAAMQEFTQHTQQYLGTGKIPEAVLVELLQAGGCFYHCPHRAAPAAPAQAGIAGVTFLRGLSPGDSRYMSGAGMYCKTSSDGSSDDVGHMFGLQKILSDMDLDRWENSLQEQRREHMDGWEFLNLALLKENMKYWKDRPDLGTLSLARKQRKTEKAYMLYRYDGRSFLCRTLPEYWSQGTRYLPLAVALLSRRGTLPSFLVEDDGPVVSLKAGYLLPPAEETFFRLYSWPDMGKKNPRFIRVMARPVFEAFQILMTHLGYTFLEESHG